MPSYLNVFPSNKGKTMFAFIPVKRGGRPEIWIIPAFVFLVVLLLFVVWGGSNPRFSEIQVVENVVFELTDDVFHKQIKNGLWMIEFYNPRCSFCKRFAPVWSEVSLNFKDLFKSGRVDITKEIDLARLYDIKSVPTVKIFSDGKFIADYLGAKTTPALEIFLREQLLNLGRLTSDDGSSANLEIKKHMDNKAKVEEERDQ